VATRNHVCQTETVYLRDPADRFERGIDCLPTRGGVPSPHADADLREARYSIEPIDGDPSTSVFFVSKCSTTSGKSNVPIHLP
jgi:hypothetical protein